MNKIKGIIYTLREMYRSLYVHYGCTRYNGWGSVGKGVHVASPTIVSGKHNIYLGNNVNIDWDSVLYATNAKLIFGNNSGAAVGCTFITGNHRPKPGELLKERGNDNLEGKDIIIGEEVWVGAKSVVLAGTKIGRGAIVSAGSVVRGIKIPPYAIVAGNPAKIVGYRYTPEEIVYHESVLYPEEERIPLKVLQKNYDKYFENREKIVEYISPY